ncbi:thymidine kinase [Xanthovirga aplysinae]|uniref:thymidine kinase n=1 Tax=Xanthovirga aplysinae TaxID=2529853 RepID=UPI0012BD4BB1|nr:thymidine kinase [Xanthovirga aplysinae]MTI33620.1 thymidine kinase [Xanthovirga aplysinae]
MFIEPHLGHLPHVDGGRSGWIEVISGSMFSGKTEELIRRLNRAIIARQKVEIFKPAVDKRFHDLDVVSHNGSAIRSTPVSFAQDIIMLAENSDVVGIDEAQFFDESLPDVCAQLAKKGKRIIIAGLDMDFAGKPFGPMPALLSVAEYITKVHAICVQCGGIANHSFRFSPSKAKVMLGERDAYEARCRKCFNEGIADQKQESEKHFGL